jgi:hypothetical protein
VKGVGTAGHVQAGQTVLSRLFGKGFHMDRKASIS